MAVSDSVHNRLGICIVDLGRVYFVTDILLSNLASLFDRLLASIPGNKSVHDGIGHHIRFV